MASWPTKDPDDVLDYVVDWTARLNGDTITSSEFIEVDGIEMFDINNDASTATVWIRGGTAGTVYNVTNRIQTAGGRTIDQTVSLPVREQ